VGAIKAGLRKTGSSAKSNHKNKSGEAPHSTFSRRNFLKLTGSTAACGALSGGLINSAGAAMGPADKFDSRDQGRHVVDPSQSLRGSADIGIRWA